MQVSCGEFTLMINTLSQICEVSITFVYSSIVVRYKCSYSAFYVNASVSKKIFGLRICSKVII
jgi:hypothetical protein